MLQGIINCPCGQLFGFETIEEIIYCPMCQKEYLASDYGVETNPPDEEVTDNGTSV